jgi:hypothetical protein
MKSLTLTSCKNRLAKIWLIGVGVVFVLFLVQSAMGKYESLQEAWQWFLPMWLPTLSLMVGVFVADAGRPAGKENLPDAFTFKLAKALSIAYLGALCGTLLLEPVATRVQAAASPMVFLKLSNLWLVPVQGLASAILGAFFIKRQR